MEYYSAIKKIEIMPFAATWMDLDSMILSEVSQTEKQMSYDITYIWYLKRGCTMNLQNRRVTDVENNFITR